MLDHLLDPDSPSKKELWLERKVEERTIEIQDLLDDLEDLPEWFQEVVDWNTVEERLSNEFAEQWEEDQAEAVISAWEERQEALDAECRGW